MDEITIEEDGYVDRCAAVIMFWDNIFIGETYQTHSDIVVANEERIDMLLTDDPSSCFYGSKFQETIYWNADMIKPEILAKTIINNIHRGHTNLLEHKHYLSYDHGTTVTLLPMY